MSKADLTASASLFGATALLLCAAVAITPVAAQDAPPFGVAAGIAGLSTGEFQGSVVRGKEVPGVLPLSLAKAIDLGLQNNLGLLLSGDAVTSARGQRWIELSRLLPDLTSSASMHREKESIAITGLTLPGVPAVVGPFNWYDARISLRQRLFDLESIKRVKAAGYELAAAQLSEKDARELVVVAVGSAYLQTLAGYARVETVTAQVATANTMLANAVEMHKAGVTPGIDELRARVEWLTRTQDLIVARNDLAKEKLSLLRVIGLPVGQEIVLTDKEPFAPFTGGSPADLVARALATRDDYRAAENLVKAAEATHEAARAERLPSLVVDADYGLTGTTTSNMTDTFHIVGSLQFPIFQGGRVRGDVLRAEALVKQRKEERDDLRGRIEYEVRAALLDIDAAAKEVDVALQNVELSELSLWQAQERFRAGVDDNLGVVQAQQAVAGAHEALVSSQYRLNLAKLLLQRAVGTAGAASIGGG